MHLCKVCAVGSWFLDWTPPFDVCRRCMCACACVQALSSLRSVEHTGAAPSDLQPVNLRSSGDVGAATWGLQPSSACWFLCPDSLILFIVSARCLCFSYLDLSSNSLSGTIPDFSVMTALEYMALCGNAFPGELSSLTWGGGNPRVFLITLSRCKVLLDPSLPPCLKLSRASYNAIVCAKL